MAAIWGRIVCKSDKVGPFDFPLTVAGTYVIKSGSDSDIALPDDWPDVSLVLRINEGRKISLENASEKGCVTNIAVNKQRLPPTDKIMLSGDDIMFVIGEHEFVFSRIESPSCSTVKSVINLCKSVPCDQCSPDSCPEFSVPVSLACKHRACVSHVTNLSRSESSSSPTTSPASKVSDRRLMALALGSRNKPFKEAEKMSVMCKPCNKLVAVQIPNLTLQEIVKNLSHTFRECPKCVSCSNSRCYYFCETCRQSLCALCVLESHRTHKLANGIRPFFETNRKFCNQLLDEKVELKKMMKKIEKRKHLAQIVQVRLVKSLERLARIQQEHQNVVKRCKETYNNLVELQKPQVGEHVEIERRKVFDEFTKCIQDFRTQNDLMQHVSKVAEKLLVQLNDNVASLHKRNVINEEKLEDAESIKSE